LKEKPRCRGDSLDLRNIPLPGLKKNRSKGNRCAARREKRGAFKEAFSSVYVWEAKKWCKYPGRLLGGETAIIRVGGRHFEGFDGAEGHWGGGGERRCHW